MAKNTLLTFPKGLLILLFGLQLFFLNWYLDQQALRVLYLTLAGVAALTDLSLIHI